MTTHTEDPFYSLQIRNAERIKAAIQRLGRSYLLHPDNRLKRKVSPEAAKALDDADVQIRALKNRIFDLEEENRRLRNRVEAYPQTHLNPAGSLPPVDCPLLIELGPGKLVAAVRPSFIPRKSSPMTYRLSDGSMTEGRFRWTYP